MNTLLLLTDSCYPENTDILSRTAVVRMHIARVLAIMIQYVVKAQQNCGVILLGLLLLIPLEDGAPD